MPEGPELHLSSRFINNVCRGRLFGKIQKSEISKNPVVLAPASTFAITASSRGKEIKLTLTEVQGSDIKEAQRSSAPSKSLDILFTFGLAGKFDFCEASALQKHAHLNFFTSDSGPKMALSFVDYMRFGKWTPGADFSFSERGPCVLQDYENFRNNVLQNIQLSAFNKPICEVLLNQKFFNGIGNYLRAEILYRAKIPPFVSARSVLEPLAENSVKSESNSPDLLQLCNILPRQVVELESSWYDGNDRSDETNGFNEWLQCYYQDGMKNTVDHNKRTIWYSGSLGPLAPKEGIIRSKKKRKSKAKTNVSEEKTDLNGSIEPADSRQKVKKEEKQSDTLETATTKSTKSSRSTSRSTKGKSGKPDQDEEKLEQNDNLVSVKPKSRKRVSTDGYSEKSQEYVADIKLLKVEEVDKIETKEDEWNSGKLTRGRLRHIVNMIDTNTAESEREVVPRKSRKKGVAKREPDVKVDVEFEVNAAERKLEKLNENKKSRKQSKKIHENEEQTNDMKKMSDRKARAEAEVKPKASKRKLKQVAENTEIVEKQAKPDSENKGVIEIKQEEICMIEKKPEIVNNTDPVLKKSLVNSLVSEGLLLTARTKARARVDGTKSRARSGRPLQHDAVYLSSAQLPARGKLKTPLKAKRRRSSKS